MNAPLFNPHVNTASLTDFETKRLDELSLSFCNAYPKSVVEQVFKSLYHKESVATFLIEGEKIHPHQEKMFTEWLMRAGEINLTEATLTELQNVIVGPMRAEKGYRTIQNYIGQSRRMGLPPIVHFIPPRPEDVPALMAGLLDCLERMLASGVHPVVIAGVISFGFVFIHPFEDGNGRLHRFLIHHILSKTGFVPQGAIFPVSSVILKKMKLYDENLELYSKPLMKQLKYSLDDAGRIHVENNDRGLYQNGDYTPYVEFLFACIEETIVTDFKQELEFVAHFDQARSEIQKVVDLPDRLMELFINAVMQNHGKLSANKRSKHFQMLTDDEIGKMEEIVRRNLVPDKKERDT